MPAWAGNEANKNRKWQQCSGKCDRNWKTRQLNTRIRFSRNRISFHDEQIPRPFSVDFKKYEMFNAGKFTTNKEEDPKQELENMEVENEIKNLLRLLLLLFAHSFRLRF